MPRCLLACVSLLMFPFDDRNHCAVGDASEAQAADSTVAFTSATKAPALTTAFARTMQTSVEFMTGIEELEGREGQEATAHGGH